MTEGSNGTDHVVEPEIDVIVIGAGFAGLYAAYLLRQKGYSFRVFEAAEDVGGTWYWNRYPGARCDIESSDYRFTFNEEVHSEFAWTERYAAQPEILKYAEFVADRLDLRKHITFNTQVVSLIWDDSSSSWEVMTKDGLAVRSRFVVTALGLLSSSNLPDVQGVETFEGRILHTGNWPHEEVDFTGRKVAVIGTGSSGIQVIPVIAAGAENLTVFQRTANFSIPAQNRPLTAREKELSKSNREFTREHMFKSPAGYYTISSKKSIFDDTDEDRLMELERRWSIGGFEFLGAYSDPAVNLEANELLAEFVRGKIRNIVTDPEVADKLVPTSHPIMGKRPTVNTDYYQTYNRPNVELIDINKDPILEITPRSIKTASGEYEIDDLIMATGFDAVTGPYLRMDIRGENGVSLKEEWAEGARSYLGLAMADFPNLFTITGPLSATPTTNVLRSIEHHIDWIGRCLDFLRDNNIKSIKATQQAQEGWDGQIAKIGTYTVHAKTSSWYTGGNIEGKPLKLLAWVGGLEGYVKACEAVADNGYVGFELVKADAEHLVSSGT